MPRIVLHIGLMKTGTTSLQRVIQNDARVSSYIHDERFYHTNKSTTSFSTEGQDPVVISDENLTRSFHRIHSLSASLNYLHEMVPDATVLFTLREQRSFLVSAYKHHVRRTDFTGSLEDWLDTEAGKSQLELCFFDKLLAKTKEVFGESRVRSLFYEHLRDQPQIFYDGFYSLLDLECPVETGFSENTGVNSQRLMWKKKWDRWRKIAPSWVRVLLDSVFARVIFQVISRLPIQHDFAWDRLSEAKRKSLEEKFKTANLASEVVTAEIAERYGYLYP